MTPEYLEELADHVDPEKLWQSGLLRFDLNEMQQRRLDAGVALRRHAEHLRRLAQAAAEGKSLLISSLGPNTTAYMLVEMPAKHVELQREQFPASNLNKIPPMTDPLGKHWKQPKADAIAIDDTHARMSEADFHRLVEYSTSTPSGVYPGKMWKSKGPDTWFLHWFGVVEGRPDLCSNHCRKIVIV